MKYLIAILLASCTIIQTPPKTALSNPIVTALPDNAIVVVVEKTAVASSDDPLIEVREFDQGNVKGMIKKLGELDLEGHRYIYLKINSFGGSISGGMDLIQYVESLKTTVVCVVDWKAYSMGAALLASDACDKRLMTKRATILFHEPLVPEVGGNAHELRKTANELEALGKALVGMLGERLKLSEEEIAKKITAQNWTLDYHEALLVGAVDGIMEVKDMPVATPYEKPSLLQLLFGL